MNALIGVAIVNYKTASLVEECLLALSQDVSLTGLVRVVIVDNASMDGSDLRLQNFVVEQDWSDWISVVAAVKNGGFSYGNNVAWRHLLAQGCHYIWVLNPDTRPHLGAAIPLMRELNSNAAVGMVGSRLEDLDGTPQISAFNFPSPLGEFINNAKLGFLEKLWPKRMVTRPVITALEGVDWVAGASLMIKKEVIEKVGFMDEGYFLYFEEVDYCLAIQKHGYKILCEPKSRVIHHVGAATGISDGRKKAPRRPTYWFESRQRFYQKNFGYSATLLADSLWLLGTGLLIARAKIQRKSINLPPYFLRDFFVNSSFVKGSINV